MISILLVKKIAEFFVYMICGYIMVKKGFLKAADSQVITKLCLYIMSPCIIVKAFQIQATEEVARGLGLAFANAVLIHVINIIVAAIYGRVANATEVEKASVIYSNGGNLIIPIVLSVLGEEWVVYSAAFVAVFNIFVWSHGKSMFSKHAGISWKKMLLNINVVAIGIGMLLLILNIQLTGIVADAVTSLGNMLGPTSMIIVGMVLGEMKLSELFANRRIYGVLLLRLIVCPLIIMTIMKLIPIEGYLESGRTVMMISLFAAMAPCAATVNQFAILYEKDTNYASAINILSTLCCIATMPLMVALYQL